MLNISQTRKPGQTFVSSLIVFTLLWVALYVGSHWLADKGSGLLHIDLTDSYHLTPQGEFLINDVLAIHWAMGETNAEIILKRLDERTGKIRVLLENLKTNSARLQNSLEGQFESPRGLEGSPVAIINEARSRAHCDDNCYLWDEALISIQSLSKDVSNIKSYADTNDIANQLLITLSDLKQQTDAQKRDVKAIKPSSARSFFWSSPTGSSIEVIFFAVFGVLANLLVHSAEYLRKGNFKPSERWVAYAKIVYGPILAWILVTAIAVGWFDLGEYEVGVLSLPLLAFILGFYSRKTVALFDRLGKKVLGEAEKSIEKGPAEITARRKAALDKFMHSLRPRSPAEIKRTAFDLKDDIVKTIVMEKELNK
ncbi:MAG: hypothetical protein Alis3KO_30000 [Aliiglaciecola sp.]